MNKEIKVKRQEWCAVPECGKYAPVDSKTPLCRKHRSDLIFVMWALENVKFGDEEVKTKSGLVLPPGVKR